MRSSAYLIVGLPRPSGNFALFGIRFDGIGKRHPLSEDGQAVRLTPLVLFRRDRGFLVQRGGGQPELHDRRVLLIGCGASAACWRASWRARAWGC